MERSGWSASTDFVDNLVPGGDTKSDIRSHSAYRNRLPAMVGFFQELGTESDRGATILASVWIDNLLERKLRSLFKEGSSAARRKLFDLNGPFSSFSSKILAAYSLGWIHSDVFHDINLIRKIRNQFTHDLHGVISKVQKYENLSTNSEFQLDTIPIGSSYKPLLLQTERQLSFTRENRQTTPASH